MRTQHEQEHPGGGLVLDLRRPVQWAADCILARLDERRGGRPFFRVRVDNGRIAGLEHASWDFGDMTGRFLEGLVLVRSMGGDEPRYEFARHLLEQYLIGLLGGDDLVRDLDSGAVDHLFAQGSALFGLVTAFQADPRPELSAAIERVVMGLSTIGRHDRGRVAFPQVATARGSCVNHGGYPILPLVRYYELTGHRPALQLAAGISRWVLADPSPNERGEIALTGWEGHLHAWLDTYCGIVRCTRAGADLGCDVEARAAALYTWVRRTQSTRFGWIADSVGSVTCETCTISSLMRLAFTLARSPGSDSPGSGRYFDDVDRAFRNQLLENQYCRADELPLTDPALLPAVAGAFESWARPDALLQGPDIEGCCINGGIRALHLVWQHALQSEPADGERLNRVPAKGAPAVAVNFWIERPGRTLSISPEYEGESAVLTVRAHQGCRIQVRRPAGSRFVDVASAIGADDDGRDATPVGDCEAEADREWLDLGRLRAGDVRRVRVRFERSHERVLVAERTYSVDWLGPWVERLEPVDLAFGLYRPFAERPALAGGCRAKCGQGATSGSDSGDEGVGPATGTVPEIVW